ncbi:UNVERIFIED_CONTAM: hypothetical protein GTU68_032439, partial [Idotea baltica]|nr:hypothetical protein [Idotea baltica]
VPILQPCFRSDQLLITVDTHTGILLAHVPQYENFPRITDLQNSLNTDKSKLDELISELRYWIMVRRTEKTLQHLEGTAHERLPLMYGASHPLHSLSKHKVFITFHRHPMYILIVEFTAKSSSSCEVELKMFLLLVKEASIEDDPDDDSVQTSV